MGGASKDVGGSKQLALLVLLVFRGTVRDELRASWVKEKAPKVKARAGLARCLCRRLPGRQVEIKPRLRKAGLQRRPPAPPGALPASTFQGPCPAAPGRHRKLLETCVAQGAGESPTIASDSALRVSSSETAQMRGRKQEVRTEEGRWSGEDSHLREKNQNIQEGGGTEENHQQHNSDFSGVPRAFRFQPGGEVRSLPARSSISPDIRPHVPSRARGLRERVPGGCHLVKARLSWP